MTSAIEMIGSISRIKCWVVTCADMSEVCLWKEKNEGNENYSRINVYKKKDVWLQKKRNSKINTGVTKSW